MTTDRLFVILLVMLIPMTGCFGAIDNADAEDNDENETTIVNNYYYNNTTSTTTEQNIEYFSVGGTFDRDELTNDGVYYYVFNLSTNPGEFVDVIFFDYWSGQQDIRSYCDDGAEINYYTGGGYLYGSHTSCYHLVRARSVGEEFGFNLVYSVLQTTPTDLNAN